MAKVSQRGLQFRERNSIIAALAERTNTAAARCRMPKPIGSCNRTGAADADRSLDKFDFAVLVMTPDDLIVSRDVPSQAPRDNVMFEFGLFLGRLGAGRTFGLCSNADKMKLPSDLAGVSLARYDEAHAAKDLTSAVGTACYGIRQAVRQLGVASHGTAIGSESAEERLAETYFKIQADVSGLASEMHREHVSSASAGKRAAEIYIRLCQRYQKAAIDELIASITFHRHLHASIDSVRELVTQGFADAIAVLGEKVTELDGMKQQLILAAERVWRMAGEVRDHADRLTAADHIKEVQKGVSSDGCKC